MRLSIIIPVFNEEKTILPLLENVAKVNIPGVTKEIIVVNDGSSDSTPEKIEKYIKTKRGRNILFLNKRKNAGKGAAVKSGIESATGDYVIIQDADLEYNPNYIGKLMEPILNKKAEIVYGTRLDRIPHQGNMQTGYFLLHFLGNRFLSLVTSILYGQWITDMETCYKLFPKSAVQKMTIHAHGFEFEPEITAKLLKQGLRIKEVSITTEPRGYEEGKKLVAAKEGPIALWTLLKYRFTS